ncbi:MAG: helix-turn-helix transcriptional regulator [Moraxellaceae bacterium]|nr:helix-turn-helix transcriptional regulator [Moraxellaceae bacterium]MDZ4387554.1 helix-turn-helix transcriptional regulator [Moraxellaceae bacterium]
MQDDAGTSIGSIRQAYLNNASSQRDSALLFEIAQLLKQANLEQAAAEVLSLLAAPLGTTHAALLRYQSGRLEVVAGLGHAPPNKVRLPASGLLPSVLKYPARPMLRQPVDHSSVFMTAELNYELLIPMIYAEQVMGLLAFAGTDNNLPSPSRIDWISAVATFLAATWQDSSSGRRKITEKQKKELNLLSPREREVMALLPKGLTNARIAAVLGIGTGTVKTHVEHILAKLYLDDRAQAAARAVELRLGSSE